MGLLILLGLLDQGVEIDLYFGGPESTLPRSLKQRDGMRVICRDSGWQWGRWYSANRAAAFLSGSPARMWAHTRLSLQLWRNHRSEPYACIFQLSQPELLLLGLLRSQLPPIVVHPCSHAAGELRWHRIESRYALSCEPLWLHAIARMVLVVRSRLQKAGFKKPDMIIGPSNRFLELVASDYNIPRERLRLLRHPVDLIKISRNENSRVENRVLELLFVSRISARKGVDLIVALSHRLEDLKGQVHITLVGGHTQMSDYRSALRRLHPDTATYIGQRSFDEIIDLYQTANALLVPSPYEPGSLVVGEALASGLPVIVSDEVGPSGVVDLECMRIFRSGDLDAFERTVREFLPDLRARPTEISRCSRREAERWFAPDIIVGQLVAHLREAAGTDR